MEYQRLIIAGLFALVGSIIGAIITFNRSKKLERLKQTASLKMQAYVDFIKGISDGERANRIGDKQKIADANALLLDAKMRIAIYGSKEIVEELAILCGNGGLINKSDGQIIKVMQCMRNDFNKSAISGDDIYKILYNEQPK